MDRQAAHEIFTTAVGKGSNSDCSPGPTKGKVATEAKDIDGEPASFIVMLDALVGS